MQTDIAALLSNTAPILPVIKVEKAEHILPIANALAEGGIKGLEITLRTTAGIKAIELVKKAGLDVVLSAGTVTRPEHVDALADIGVDFAVTPGLTPDVLERAQRKGVQLLPGIATPSEVMTGLAYDLRFFKLFPASIVGGIGMLKALGGPFPDLKFCPTGGLNLENFRDYLSLPNVFCIGGSWMMAFQGGEPDTSEITRLAAEATGLLG
ncbi:MAG: bifunctional 4-hydroxy-2-oxoglutarate aldolase/2-dehydro-3-deoxy-phosphogluconate aldolase [Gammaproteobacteria bacterium]|nr:bifunctional 4-hydroxy-2-oxoglutarate aldolase/2-dehydro-3-deoxy-phosphogluconate aldolase [Gammaproteobacteria bacterium]MBT8152268.1 bifunctional 4-hydroxy-2-oxoglutarate aldolase/2-dehydro-3-deoxy-phosphogluconate aldolase [Gammaproteobacteria bacterium]NNM11251.1 bifunctional 4-hydroxy-2-oxoglutarate aldolase/2-dehydro-3-deoxy-phosphogluconate aldolase [Pseudomonadales bacterium]RZV56299.1 MAG: bifunctional 4-hydroxy-2-oxoglutarate aldolase/2-dehydro-3-deoxy-phosphogluconate aldolase [Pse